MNICEIILIKVLIGKYENFVDYVRPFWREILLFFSIFFPFVSSCQGKIACQSLFRRPFGFLYWSVVISGLVTKTVTSKRKLPLNHDFTFRSSKKMLII